MLERGSCMPPKESLQTLTKDTRRKRLETTEVMRLIGRALRLHGTTS